MSGRHSTGAIDRPARTTPPPHVTAGPSTYGGVGDPHPAGLARLLQNERAKEVTAEG